MNKASWIFLGTGVSALLIIAVIGFGRLGSAVTLLLLGVGSISCHYFLHRRAQSSFVDVPKGEFLRQIRPFTDLSDELLLTERSYVSRAIGVPTDKLSPRQSIDELSEALDFVGSFSVALNDLLFEIEELYEEAALKPLGKVETAGDLIIQLAYIREYARRSPD